MTITTIDEHSFCPDLLPENANILDAGCAGLNFARHFRELGYTVLAIDIQDLPEESEYLKFGIATVSGKAYVSHDKDPQARKILSPSTFGESNPNIIADNEVYIISLQDIEREFGKFDLIKLDVEGEEFHILGSATHPIAKQVSVEFHAHTGANDKEELDLLLDTLSQWYDIYNRVWEKRHGCSESYWDILMIAK